MQQKLKFKLDNPSAEKFDLWMGLSQMTDNICLKYGLVNISRYSCSKKYIAEVTWCAPDAEAIFKCHCEVNKLEVKHGVESTCIEAMQIQSPEMNNITLNLQLQKEQRTREYFEIWERISKTIDAESRRHNIYVHRTKDPANYSMKVKVSFINFYDWSYISYFAGNACGKAGLELLHYESICDPRTEDILDQISDVTRTHRQLSFDNVLTIPKLVKRG